MKRAWTVSAILAMSLTSWAGEPRYCGSTKEAAKAAAPRLDAAKEGKALVYLIGTGTWMAHTAVMIDKQFVGITERDEYLAVALDPGIHHLCVASLAGC